MAYSTTTKGLRVPDLNDQFDQYNIDGYNWTQINTLLTDLDALIGDKSAFDSTTMSAGDKASFVTAIIAAYNRAITDTVIGNRVVTQTQALPATHNTAAQLSVILSWFAKRFKDVLGTTNWIDAVPKNLTDINTALGVIGDMAGLDAATGMTAGDKASLVAAIVASYNKSASDTVIGNRVLNQAIALPAAHNTAAVLTSILSWFSKRFKDVLGTTNWIDALPTIGGVAATLTKIASMLDQDVKTTSTVNFASVTATDIYGTNYNDLAEWYNRITDDPNPPQPGDVIVYDPDRNGYRRSNEYASRLAVGVFSTHPGFTLGGEKMDDMSKNIDHNIPVALSGRVPVKIATSGYEYPGGLLVSCGNGYAICVDNPDRGTVIGKLLHPIEGELWMMQVQLG